MLSDAIKNPLIYLNFAIFCWRTKRFELANANLQNFYDLANSTNVRHEVSTFASIYFEPLFEILFNLDLQFKVIAEKLKEYLPEPVNNALDGPIIHADGADETMAEFDPNADLV